MFLQQLVEYSRREDVNISPPMYNAEPVRYWIELDQEGKLEGIIDVTDSDGKRPKRVNVPTLVRSMAVSPKLLADNAEYALGIGRETSKPERVTQCHHSFVEMTRRCAEETGESDVLAVLAFLDGLRTDELTLPPDFNPTATVSFRVEGRPVVSLPAVEAFWVNAAAEGKVMQCLICGQRRPAMERIQLKLKGIPGGQSAGLALISANAGAFTSYGLEASYVAPTCQSCSDRFMKAANHLIAGDSTHLRVGNAVYVFWTREESDFSAALLLSKPDPDDVRALLHSMFSGGPVELDPNPFYSAALTASGARAVVRDWIDTTVGRAQANLARFFHLQTITDAWGEAARPLAIWQLAKATVRSGSRDDAAPWLSQALIHCALAGGSLPDSLLFKAVERCRLERDVTPPRAALIKMVLLSHKSASSPGDDEMVTLNIDNRDAAYLCGRLFAELEAVQRKALREVGAGIVDRYYGTASSAPATVFGRLIRGAQPHLGKLRRENYGAYLAIDERLQDIQDGLDAYPTTLTLQQQGRFALGYYHQRAANRRAGQERKAARADDADADQDELAETTDL